MSDENENVGPATDVPPAPPAEDTPPAPPADEVPPAPPADETPPAPPAEDAGGAADETDANESRTGFAEKGLRPGDPCKCPDGRTGTVHSFDAGLICIPNADQG
jgi:hypothetical protein